MSLREQVAFVELEPRAGGAIEKCRVERQRAAVRPYHPRVALSRARELFLDQRFHFGLLHAGGDNGYRIGDYPARAVACRRRETVEPGVGGKGGKRLEVRRRNTI